MAEYASNLRTLLCTIAVRFPNTMESDASVASNGTQPDTNLRHTPLPSTPANPNIMTLEKMKKLATFDPDAMNAALGVGAPWYASGSQTWNGTAATLKPKPITTITSATTSSGSSPFPLRAAAIWPRLVAPDKP